MIRVSLLGFVDIQTILRAARKFKEHVRRAQRIVREYLLMKRCREKLMDLQFAKIESQVRRREREELASDLLKTSASINLQLSPSLVKEMKKVRLESLKRSSGFRKTKVQNEEVEIQSLIPENLRIMVIRENLTRRKRAFIKKILSEEKSRVGNTGNSHRYQKLKPKYVSKS
ncbi:potassium-transporting ATPase C chain [Acrasis kona]|uniref:Potassium-transporting ATPase C chain n=1 Tax=Acrasis kona TaxID=1008807 RepID=A0AAW2YZ01_9EUKA